MEELKTFMERLKVGDIVNLSVYDSVSGIAKVLSVGDGGNEITVEFNPETMVTCYSCQSVEETVFTLHLGDICNISLTEDAGNIVRHLLSANGCVPYDGDYCNSDHDWRWYLVDSPIAESALYKVFDAQVDYEFSQISKFPEWLCVSAESIDFENFSVVGDVCFITLTECRMAFDRLLGALNEREEDVKYGAV